MFDRPEIRIKYIKKFLKDLNKQDETVKRCGLPMKSITLIKPE